MENVEDHYQESNEENYAFNVLLFPFVIYGDSNLKR